MTTERFIILVLMLVSISCSTTGTPPVGVAGDRGPTVEPSPTPEERLRSLVTPGECVSNDGFWVRAKSPDVPGLCQVELEGISVGVVNTAKLNLRKSYQKDAESITVLQEGDVVLVHETSENNWSRVTTVCAVEGWVFNKYLTVTSAKPPHTIQGVEIKASESVKREQKLSIDVEFITTAPKEGARLFFCLHPVKEEAPAYIKGNAEFAEKGQWTYSRSFNINKNAPLGDWIAHVTIYYTTGWLDITDVRFKVTQ
ncbi:MAG: SH3 domain-containing protein [Nitrospirae bacterium]|nr:SH3 domain-containing protein [Nitrospirota bacterium]